MIARDGVTVTHTAHASALALCASLAACATSPSPSPMETSHASGVNGTLRPYAVNGVWYHPHPQPRYDETGVATWYGRGYDGRRTADGERFASDRPTGAHTTLPLPCYVEVTNLDNGRRLRIRLNDRGPFVRGRILDVSPEAAKTLGFYQQGTARVRVRYLGPAPGSALAEQPRTDASGE